MLDSAAMMPSNPAPVTAIDSPRGFLIPRSVYVRRTGERNAFRSKPNYNKRLLTAMRFPVYPRKRFPIKPAVRYWIHLRWEAVLVEQSGSLKRPQRALFASFSAVHAGV